LFTTQTVNKTEQLTVMCAVVRLRGLMARQAAWLITNLTILSFCLSKIDCFCRPKVERESAFSSLAVTFRPKMTNCLNILFPKNYFPTARSAAAFLIQTAL
jgi:hypothetical protein